MVCLDQSVNKDVSQFTGAFQDLKKKIKQKLRPSVFKQARNAMPLVERFLSDEHVAKFPDYMSFPEEVFINAQVDDMVYSITNKISEPMTTEENTFLHEALKEWTCYVLESVGILDQMGLDLKSEEQGRLADLQQRLHRCNVYLFVYCRTVPKGAQMFLHSMGCQGGEANSYTIR